MSATESQSMYRKRKLVEQILEEGVSEREMRNKLLLQQFSLHDAENFSLKMKLRVVLLKT